MRNYSAKVCLVTGASRGIGRAIAKSLADTGATVIVTGRSVKADSTTDGLPHTIHETAAEITELGGKGVAIKCDHTKDEDVDQRFMKIQNEFGQLDLLVNNVWGGYENYRMEDFGSSFWDQPVHYWQSMFEAGVRAHYYASRNAARLMIQQKSGLIINISAGDEGKYLLNMLYDLAKNAVDRMVFAMSQELQEFNIAAVGLYPGFTRTERVLKALGDENPPGTESPYYTGRAVKALFTNENVMAKTGKIFKVGNLAREYNFHDIDATQPEPWCMPE